MRIMRKLRISQYLFATLVSVTLITSHSVPILAEEEILSGDESVIDSIEEISDEISSDCDEISSDCDEIFMPYAGEGIFADATQIGNVGERYFNYEPSKAVKINLNTAYYTICYKTNNGYDSDGFYAFYRFDALMEGKYTISILAPGTFDLSLHKGTVDSTNPMGRLYKNDSIAQKTIVTGLQAGDYLVRVDTTGKSTNYSNPDKIFLRVDYTPANLDSSNDWIELETNDDFYEPMPYTIGKRITGSRYIGEVDNSRTDTYTFTTTQNGFITFSELSNIASNIEIYNSARNSIAYIKPTGNYSKSIGLAPGKYYFKLVGIEDTTNYDATKYTFKIDFTEYNNVETEENGRLTRSNSNMNNDIYQTIDVNKTYWGSFYGEEDGDLYKVNIPETMDSLTVNFSTDMTGAKIYIDGGIYDLSGKSYTIDDRKITAGEHKIGFFIGEIGEVSASNKTYTFNIGGEAAKGPGEEEDEDVENPLPDEKPLPTPIYKPEKSEAYIVDSIINYDVYLVKGGRTTIDAIAKSKSDGKDYKLTLDSKAKKIVSVSNKGVIKGKADGTATVLLEKVGIKYKLNITVATPTFTNPKRKYEVNAGEKINLELKNINTAPQFSSKKTSVATVDKATGEVTGLKAGKTNIIVMVNGKKFTCNVKVYDPVIKGKPLIKVGKKQKLSIKNGPKASSFLSSNTNVATIDSAGRLNAISAGKTTITAVSNGKTITFEVTVIE